jgi:hypothetical protein
MLRLISVVLILVFSAGISATQQSPPTTPKSNQGSGESEVAKHSSILPEKSSTGGSAESSSGEAAQIERSAAPLKLTAAQRQKVKSYFAAVVSG